MASEYFLKCLKGLKETAQNFEARVTPRLQGMNDQITENKKTDEAIDKIVENIMSDISARKAGNSLFDDIVKCFWVKNDSFLMSNQLDTHMVRTKLLGDI